ncbi:MAG: helix-turn-helix transcriptional regulator [Xenococcus sp. MO_188.B8]|nr:helix-turn-helix transcriptional regulator [Xenococcus sp. MO_188.B8]
MNRKEKIINKIAKSKISELREKVGLTQLQLSKKLGITETTVQNWESGRAGLEQLERFVNLCKVLNCRAEDLIEYQKQTVHVGVDETKHNEPEVIIKEIQKMLIRKKQI